MRKLTTAVADSLMSSSLRSVLLFLLCLSTAISYIDRQALAVVLPVLRGDLGISSSQYGIATTAFLLCYTAGQFFSGPFIDRIGVRRGFIFFVGLWSVMAAAHVVASGALSLAVLRGLLGLGESGNWPAGAKAVAQWFPVDRRAFAMGVFDSGSAIGTIVATPLVAGLSLWLGWRAAFAVTGALGFLWLVVWVLAYRRDNNRDTSPAASAQARVQILRSPKLLGLMVTRMTATPIWWFYVFWLPDYLSKDRHFSLRDIGLFGWIPFLTVDLGKLVGGACSDALLRRNATPTLARKIVMAVGALAMVGGTQVFTAGSAAAAVAWVSVATFGFGLWSANILALHADLFAPETMATAVGFTGMAASLGGSAFTFLTGIVLERYGYQPIFWAAGTLSVLALTFLIAAVGKVERIELQHATT